MQENQFKKERDQFIEKVIKEEVPGVEIAFDMNGQMILSVKDGKYHI